MKTAAILIFVYVLFILVIIYPFLPGDYDPVGSTLSTFLQLYSIAGLIACLPAILWFYRNRRVAKAVTDAQVEFRKSMLAGRIYVWVSIIFLIVPVLLTMFLSRLVFILLVLSLIIFSIFVFKRLADLRTGQHIPSVLPAGLALLPVTLIAFQLVITVPLTNWSRNTAIKNSSGLIEEIERYKARHGKFPITLNAINKDFKTGINSIEKYHYTYDNTSYNVYFEQTRFFFHKFGTRELVVYNPADNHLMVSHVVWHMLFEPGQLRSNQGWYAYSDTGVQHWKSFYFD